MNVEQLRSFLALMSVRNFHRAAESRHLSQPSLSQQIRSLETELGTLLFDRTHRPVLPTEAANVLERGARRILAELDDLAAEVRDAEGETRGAVVVGALQYLALLELPE